MADLAAVQVGGLSDFRKQLKQADSGLPKMLRLVNNESAQLVVDGITGVPQESGKAKRSIRVASTQKRVRIKGGSKRVPYYPWLDFGGQAGRVKRQFRKRGRYIYKSYFKARDSGEFTQVMARGLRRLGDQAGLEIE